MLRPAHHEWSARLTYTTDRLPSDDLPLAGLKIAVTRPREQAVSLARQIVQAGGTPLLFPLLEIAPAPDEAALRDQVARLAQFDLVVFVSPNAVSYGMAAIRAALAPDPSHASGREAGTEDAAPPLPGGLAIAAVGQGSAKALRALGVADVIAPTERFDSEGLLALPDLQNVAGRRVLIFRGDGGRELLGDTLRARGATVEYAACYQRSGAKWDAETLLEASPDAITVTSSEALGYLWQMAASTQAAHLRAIPIFVPHKRIADLAIEQGWEKVWLTDAGDDGLLSALIAWGRRPET